MSESDEQKFVSAAELVEKLFGEILASDEFDAEVVSLAKEHLGSLSPHTKAGANLSDALIKLAIKRAEAQNDMGSLKA